MGTRIVRVSDVLVVVVQFSTSGLRSTGNRNARAAFHVITSRLECQLRTCSRACHTEGSEHAYCAGA